MKIKRIERLYSASVIHVKSPFTLRKLALKTRAVVRPRFVFGFAGEVIKTS